MKVAPTFLPGFDPSEKGVRKTLLSDGGRGKTRSAVRGSRAGGESHKVACWECVIGPWSQERGGAVGVERGRPQVRAEPHLLVIEQGTACRSVIGSRHGAVVGG